jgi:hypothetical protein
VTKARVASNTEKAPVIKLSMGMLRWICASKDLREMRRAKVTAAKSSETQIIGLLNVCLS